MKIGVYKNLIGFYKNKIIISVSHNVNVANLFDKDTMIMNHHTGNFKISNYDLQRNQIVLDMWQFNIENDLKML
jgi:hypothetical protein